jgi:hypothetical protein
MGRREDLISIQDGITDQENMIEESCYQGPAEIDRIEMELE